MTDEVATALVEANNFTLPGRTAFRCILCNCSFVTKCDGPCPCRIAVCPNVDCPGHQEFDDVDEGDER
jgi:hypothetical protein